VSHVENIVIFETHYHRDDATKGDVVLMPVH